MKSEALESLFPTLRHHHYEIVRPNNQFYNCLALANHDRKRYWDYKVSMGGLYRAYWPTDVRRSWQLETITFLFERRGYYVCNTVEYEGGFEKVALYTDVLSQVNHVAIMSGSGMWLSKLGRFAEIEHEKLTALEGLPRNYGWVSRILKRPLRD